jgi:hypothetical protein
VDLDLKNSAEEWTRVASWLLNVNFCMWVDCCRFVVVVCGIVSKFGSGSSLSGELFPEFDYFKTFQVFLVPEVVCLGSWFRNNVIILKSFKFTNFNTFGLVPAKDLQYPNIRSGGK